MDLGTRSTATKIPQLGTTEPTMRPWYAEFMRHAFGTTNGETPTKAAKNRAVLTMEQQGDLVAHEGHRDFCIDPQKCKVEADEERLWKRAKVWKHRGGKAGRPHRCESQ